MKALKFAAHSALLATGMFLYSCIAVSAFQDFFFVAPILSMAVLVVLGFTIRRRYWPAPIEALTVVGFGLLGFFAVLLLIGISQGGGLVDMLRDIGQMMVSIYGVWFWFPFIVGVMSGGFHRRNIQAEQGADDQAAAAVE